MKSEKKPSSFVNKHIVSCPHCEKDVLDHMTACPFCGGELIPSGYNPPDPAKLKKVKITAWIVFGIAAALIALFIILR